MSDLSAITRTEILQELAEVLRRRRFARDNASPKEQAKHNIGIDRLQAAYDFVMRNMADEQGRLPWAG